MKSELMTESLVQQVQQIKEKNGDRPNGFNLPKEDQRKAIPQSEATIEYIDVHMTGLPKETDSKLIKSMYFRNQHVVEAVPEINSLTGMCTGKAKVKVRCQDTERSEKVLKSLRS